MKNRDCKRNYISFHFAGWKTVSKDRSREGEILFSLSAGDFLVPRSNCVVSIEKSPAKLVSTSPSSFFLPGSRRDESTFYQRRINGIVCEGESKTNRYYHYFHLLFFANFPFRVECTTAYLPLRVTIPSNGVIARSPVADYFVRLWQPEFLAEVVQVRNSSGGGGGGGVALDTA